MRKESVCDQEQPNSTPKMLYQQRIKMGVFVDEQHVGAATNTCFAFTMNARIEKCEVSFVHFSTFELQAVEFI